jgi:hypothetical protein
VAELAVSVAIVVGLDDERLLAGVAASEKDNNPAGLDDSLRLERTEAVRSAN